MYDRQIKTLFISHKKNSSKSGIRSKAQLELTCESINFFGQEPKNRMAKLEISKTILGSTDPEIDESGIVTLWNCMRTDNPQSSEQTTKQSRCKSH